VSNSTPSHAYKRLWTFSPSPFRFPCTRRRQAVGISRRSLQTPTAFIVDSDAIRYPAARFLHLLDSSLPCASPHHFGLPQEAPERHPRQSPEPPEANAASSRPSPPSLDVNDVAVLAFELASTFCTPSIHPPASGAPGTSPMTTVWPLPRRSCSSKP
jgi:hypothetical protein